MVTSNPWLWLAAFWTLSLYTVAFADNPVYRFSESVYIGVSAGYMVTANWFNWIRPNMDAIVKGRYLLIVPFILGLLVYTRYIKSVAWMSRIAIAFNLGVGAGLILSRDFKSLFLAQVIATFRALNTIPSNWILVFGTVVSLIYFLFTIEQKGIVGYSARAGRWVMMLALGAAFGSTVMARVSLFLGRVQFLLQEWLFIVK
jgi:hypothetical protein